MTAWVALHELPLDRIVRAAPYHATYGESLLGLRPGQRISVRDLLYGMVLVSGNDAAYDLALAAAGSEKRFVRQMNGQAAALGLADTHYANPIGLDQRGNYSSARDLTTLAQHLLRIPAFARIADSRSAVLRSLRPPRRIVSINELLHMAPWVNGVKTGHTFAAGFVLVGSGRRKGVELISSAIGAPTDEDRFSDNLRLLDYGFSLYRRRTAVRAGQTLAEPAIRYAGGELPLVSPRTVKVAIRHGQRLTVRGQGAERGGGADPRRRGARPGEGGPRRVPGGDGPAARRPLDSPGERAPEGGQLRLRKRDPACAGCVRDTDWRGIPVASPAPWRRWRGADPGESQGDAGRRRSEPGRGVGRVILTVTLNAAIDRTVAVPNFRLGRRHRAVESRTVAGGKGINVARALSLLGRPVIATGFAGGPTGARVLEQLQRRVGAHRLHPDRRRDADQPGGDRPHLRRADRDQRARPGGQPGGGGGVLRADRLPGRRREDLRAGGDPAAGRRRRPLRAPGQGPVRPRHRRRARRRGGGDDGRAAGRRLGRHPQRARGRGAGRPGVRRPRRPRPGPLRAGPPRRRRGGDHPARRLRRGGRRGIRAPLPRGPHRAPGPGLHGRLRRRLPRRLRGRSLRGPPARTSASPTVSPAGPSRPSTSAPARSTAARSSACSARWRCTIWRSPRKCRLAVQRHPGGPNWRSTSVEARRGGAPTDSTTSRSSRRAAPAIPTT